MFLLDMGVGNELMGQALVSSILLRTHPETLQTALPIRSRGRQIVESAKDGVLGHIKRRWLQIKATGGFNGLEMWAMKEIADGKFSPKESLCQFGGFRLTIQPSK